MRRRVVEEIRTAAQILEASLPESLQWGSHQIAVDKEVTPNKDSETRTKETKVRRTTEEARTAAAKATKMERGAKEPRQEKGGIGGTEERGLATTG
jgi:hypothetical protein